MPRRSLWKGSFVDAFLYELKNQKDRLANRKVWSRRSSILPEFLNSTIRIYNGKHFVRCKVTEEKVGHKFGEFALTRKRRPMGATKGAPKVVADGVVDGYCCIGVVRGVECYLKL
ncbi:hypothetical protein LWI28_026568 [Acer negundo]|uniref:Small ribosomal subunit protein uS19m n=1 Tax=Acer negundo TaxID=4023 RepID=A0AAD5JHE6_ACENE|nr:hypothetical protein LWI28_026568 [Acer negundo]KAK4853010.1 hypothetical protein QYF36_002275 [Acer negundo]